MLRPGSLVGSSALGGALLGGALLGCSPRPLSPSTGGEAAHPRARASAPAPSLAPTAVIAPTAAPTAASAPAVTLPVVLDIHNASTHHDFRLVMAPASEDQEECSSSADLVIFPKGTTTETQRVHLESVCVVRDPDGAVLVNSAKLYEDQGTLVVDDFDFDGREDLAIQVSHQGPYGGPTFRVLLGLATPGEFAFSPALSLLTEENLGLFEVDPKRRRLVTRSKSGCCIHTVEEDVIVKGTPHSVYRQTETGTPDGQLLIETQTLVNGRWRKSARRVPIPD